MDVLDFLLDSVTGVSFFSDIFRHPSKNISSVDLYRCMAVYCDWGQCMYKCQVHTIV